MKKVYIDESTIISFLFQKDHNHNQALNYIAKFLSLQDQYYYSFFAVLFGVEKLRNKLNLNKKIPLSRETSTINKEKEITKAIDSVMDKIRARFILSIDNKTIQLAYSLSDEYNISFLNAFHTAIMIQNKIRTIATVDDGFDVLFAEGLIRRY